MRCHGQSPRRKFTLGGNPYTRRQNVGSACKRRVNKKCQISLTRENLHGMLNISAKRQFTWDVKPHLLRDNLHGKSAKRQFTWEVNPVY